MLKCSVSAGMVELVDSVDLGSTAKSVQVRVLLPAPNKKTALYCFGTRRSFVLCGAADREL